MTERLLSLPIETARLVGAGVLWIVDHAVPPETSVETKAANIQIFTTGEVDENVG